MTHQGNNRPTGKGNIMKTDLIREALHDVRWPDQRTQIPQVRIEVNTKCGKACFYCRPTGEGMAISELERASSRPFHELSVQEFVEVVTLLARHGVTELKLTGGDPMLRPDIIELISSLKAIPNIMSIHMVPDIIVPGIWQRKSKKLDWTCSISRSTHLRQLPGRK